MLKRLITGALCLAVFMSTAVTASAFNGARRGFVLGGGLGGSFTSYEAKSSSIFVPDVSESETGVGTDFRIGGGVNDQVMLYYTNRVAWFSPADATVAFGASSFGLSYYFKTEAPSFYILGAVGLSSWSLPFETNSSSGSGIGLSGGVGYEFARHWSLEATVNYGAPDFTGIDLTVVSVLVTIVGLAY